MLLIISAVDNCCDVVVLFSAFFLKASANIPFNLFKLSDNLNETSGLVFEKVYKKYLRMLSADILNSV